VASILRIPLAFELGTRSGCLFLFFTSSPC
jgi:hypothetical protein